MDSGTDPKVKPLDLEVHSDVPPEYSLHPEPTSDVAPSSSTVTYHEQSAELVLSVPVASHVISPSIEPRRQENHYWKRCLNRHAWSCFIYLLLVSFPLSLFAFIWVSVTFVFAFATLIFPPVAFVYFYLAAWSYRVLAFVELAAQNLLCDAQSQRYLPPVLTPRRNQSISISVAFLKELITDHLTWGSIVYFLFLKLALSIVLFVVVLTIFMLCIPFSLCLLPRACAIYCVLGEWHNSLTCRILLPKGYNAHLQSSDIDL
ncbi:hypothetical protein K493DRAFT_309860, partial [Basidiobolus meristosporus CBS 931.73]